MNIEIPVAYIESRIKITDKTTVGITAERFLTRLEKLVALVNKYDPKGVIAMNEGDAEMFDLYCEESKAAVVQKPRQTKAKVVKGA